MNASLPLTLARAMACMAPPSSVVHAVIEADRLAADRAYNAAKATVHEREAERALRDQMQRQQLLMEVS